MTVAKKVLVIAGGVAVVAIGTAVVVVTCPAIAAQAGTYILANGCLVAREILSSVFAVGGVAWLIWDYFRSGSGPSASSASYHHRNQQQPRMNAQGLQVYHHWETNPIPLSSRSPSTYQSSRGRRHERSNSVVSMVSDFELELPVSGNPVLDGRKVKSKLQVQVPDFFTGLDLDSGGHHQV
ncbi:hypothetical protein BGX33_000309 [Mortierella sp. NVP41]|nr:hypothetical protein BGX33_000309 [Mortierella sp. NVP41]